MACILKLYQISTVDGDWLPQAFTEAPVSEMDIIDISSN